MSSQNNIVESDQFVRSAVEKLQAEFGSMNRAIGDEKALTIILLRWEKRFNTLAGLDLDLALAVGLDHMRYVHDKIKKVMAPIWLKALKDKSPDASFYMEHLQNARKFLDLTHTIDEAEAKLRKTPSRPEVKVPPLGVHDLQALIRARLELNS